MLAQPKKETPEEIAKRHTKLRIIKPIKLRIIKPKTKKYVLFPSVLKKPNISVMEFFYVMGILNRPNSLNGFITKWG